MSSEQWQILKSNTQNKPLSEKAKRFIAQNLQNASPLRSDAEILMFAMQHTKIDGLYLEFGTWRGCSTNFIAGLLGAIHPEKTLHTFDSFKGLPSDWNEKHPKGSFALKDDSELPFLLPNIELHKGWFKDSLLDFKEKHRSPISFINIDCDLYESTKDIFDIIGSQITSGTIINFDDFYNYEGSEEHEEKAFYEFINKYQLNFEYLAYNPYHEQVVIRITP